MNSVQNQVNNPSPRQFVFGLRWRMFLLAVLPVLLAGGVIFYSVYNNVGQLVSDLYVSRTNKTVEVLMGNIDFTKPQEIEREFKQAMVGSDIIAMYLTQTNVGGQVNSQVVFRDQQGKTIFEAREPKYLAVKENPTAMRDYFINLSINKTEGALTWMVRGTGLGGVKGALDTRMLGFADQTTLAVPNGTASASGFGIVVIEDGEKLVSNLWVIGWTIIGSIIGAVIIATIIGSLVSQSVVRPVLQLTKLANAMSTGDLNTPIKMTSRDEVGMLGESLERTRLSLRLAIERAQRKRAE